MHSKIWPQVDILEYFTACSLVNWRGRGALACIRAFWVSLQVLAYTQSLLERVRAQEERAEAIVKYQRMFKLRETK